MVQTDASTDGLGAVPLQECGGVLCSTDYASHTRASAEFNNYVTNEECVGIVFPFKMFKFCLEGATFSIGTAHYGLAWWKKNLKKHCRTPGTVGTFLRTVHLHHLVQKRWAKQTGGHLVSPTNAEHGG